MSEINFDIITIEECFQLKESLNRSVVINDGKIVEIVEED